MLNTQGTGRQHTQGAGEDRPVNLGGSILGNSRPNTAAADEECLRRAAQQLQERGEGLPPAISIKREAREEDWRWQGQEVIDLTADDVIVVSDDEVEPSHAGELEPSNAGELEPKSRPKKRKATGASSHSKRAKGPSFGVRSKFSSAEQLKKVRDTTLFGSLRGNAEAPELPAIDIGALKRDSRNQYLTELLGQSDKAKEEQILKDARHLNRAAFLFGAGVISQADDPEMQGKAYKVKGMKSTLKPHQVIGTAFMIQCEKQGHGGILADQMGLGKTVMGLALVVRGRHRERTGGKTTLIVATPALRDQWFDEIAKHCNTVTTRSGIGNYIKYRARDEEWRSAVAMRELAKQDIIITTYNEVSNSYPLEEPPKELVDHDERQAWWEAHFEEKKGQLHTISFRRIILDEAHLIRNPKARISRACRSLKGEYRWSMTGTPMTNGVFDLWALLDFAKVPNLDDYGTFKDKYSTRPDDHDSAEEELNKTLALYMIQRSHADRLFGSKLISLPPADIEVLKTNFNRVEQEIYNIVRMAFAKRINRMIKQDGGFFKNNGGYAMITRLRQLTAHPLLVQSTLLDMLEREDLRKLEKVVASYKVDPDDGKLLLKLKKVLKNAKKKAGSRAEETVADVNEEIGHAAADDDDDNETGGRYGLTFKFDKYLQALKTQSEKLNADAIQECCACFSKASNPQVTSCLHVYCLGCLHELQADAAQEGLGNAACVAKDCGQVYAYAEPCEESIARALHKVKDRKTMKPKQQDLPSEIEDWLDKGGQICPSAKTVAVKAQILNWKKEYPNDKIVIYSSWTPMIRILEKMCKTESWPCCLYYGKMAHDTRARTIERFHNDPELKIMIANLKCGGLGLNLTMASKVIIVDTWFNNAVIDQAFGRVFRIGQTKDSHMLQVLVHDTFDIHMEEIRKKKQANIDAFSGEAWLKHLDREEMLGIFGKVVKGANGELSLDVPDGEDEGEESSEDDDGEEEDDDEGEDVDVGDDP